ncbi:WYL domain-containing protein [Myxococcus llanfairpwllgwyngyllgogerychwyrndrobwllllantysiliogogogochensis]|uniref:WYL domain-containing protein n=1 Tax=Myxococcus llanfairpwllgwyngyllgogerychwyrndrobwllllantysiliogogogochensis TaxID=2590453 RepID=A0A540X2X5_9BACT|nr:WYL domain-containing protein [Myxococcus llanfairpwllgwyngyllgogerychwyrndrobwllllantysiliogogogochensis]TQF15576.1 WYL domain-containing protein [Myxococcus llanfairpwllgwyngyllgogerychwyrndrobwllllantysiliogogogochensis]
MKREPVIDRLDRVLGLLASRPSWTAPELAEELGVCVRTIRRDLSRLAARGVPIESDAGRGGGVRVPPRTGLGRVQLDTREVLDLMLALALAEQLGSPLLLSTLKGLRQKLSASFPPEERTRVSGLRRRILVGPSSRNVAATWKAPSLAVLRPIHESFFEQRALELTYRSNDASTVRVVEPHYLLLSWPAWFLLVWDHLRGAVRMLRVDRIESARVTESTFRVRSSESMLATLGDVFAAL